MKVLCTHVLIALSGLSGLWTSALGQDYPSKSVRILVGYPPAGLPDFTARTVAQALSQALGQPFVVENKPGAGGTLAGASVAQSPADGYTLLSGDTGPLEIVPQLLKAPPYSALRDLTPISMLWSIPVLFVSSSKSQIGTVKDIIREAKANPGKLNYGSVGHGSFQHIVFEAFNAAAGTKMTHIPFKGATSSIPALLSGDLHVIQLSLGAAAAQRQAGKINLIGVTSAERDPFAPEVPAIAEDLRGFDFAAQGGILAPAGLPANLLAKLSKAIKAATETPDMQEKYKKLGVILISTTPEAYGETIRQNLKKYGQVIKNANIQAE